jgi:hypothetical protein
MYVANSFVNAIQMNKEDSLTVPIQTDFVSKVKRWVMLDTQLKMVHEKVKTMREERQQLSGEICTYLETHDMAHKKIGIHDGDLKIYEKKEYSPLTFSFLETHLATLMTDPTQVEFVIDYLKEHREIKTVQDLKRTYKTTK